METSGRQRAAAEFRLAVERLGATPTDIARRGGIPDPDTVRDFMAGERWPHASTRHKLEAAVGWEAGSISALERGEAIAPATVDTDHVVAAIEASELTRANRHRLIGTYYDMLDQQASEEVKGA